MVSNYLIFLLSYFLIVLSVIGHGVLAIKLTKTNVSIEEIVTANEKVVFKLPKEVS